MMTEKNEGKVQQTFIQIFLRFLRYGFLAWGGPIVQIAMLRKELVEEEKWVNKERFNKALAVFQILPGPEAHEMCVWFGMMAGGRAGGFLAGLGFMLPGLLLMSLLTWLYIQFGFYNAIVKSVFFGFQVAVISLIVVAVFRLAKKTLQTISLLITGLLSAVVSYVGVPFLIVLPLAGLLYFAWQKKKIWMAIFIGFVLAGTGVLFNTIKEPSIQPDTVQQYNVNSSSGSHTNVNIFLTGLKGGLLSFGGAYTVIPIMEKDAVRQYKWLTEEQFLDGIALSSVIPAPLIIFTAFIGYFGGEWLGLILMTIGIFLPAFSFTLFGHKVIDIVIENKSIHDFLEGVTAGVIGLITVTALQLGIHTITGWGAILLFILSLAALLLFKSKFGPMMVIIGAGVIGYFL